MNRRCTFKKGILQFVHVITQEVILQRIQHFKLALRYREEAGSWDRKKYGISHIA